jgi:hypothetical protein
MSDLAMLFRLALASSEGDQLLDDMAVRVADRITSLVQRSEDRWMDAREAAIYLGFDSVAPLHKLTAAKAVPFSQDVAGGKCWFKRSELDRWREEGAQ